MKPFWDEMLNQLKGEVDESEFNFWLEPLACLRSDQSRIVVEVPSKFFRDKLEPRYLKRFKELLADLTGRDITLEFEVRKREDTPTPRPRKQEVSEDEGTARRAEKPKAKKHTHNPGLRPEFSFDHFVIGENDFAYNAALGVAGDPGTRYNPFMIYGGVGLGKTHLMQAIGNHICQLHPDLTVLCVSANTFLTDYVNAMKSSHSQQFAQKYRNVDVLLLDDIHELQRGKETQEELFHTFKALHDKHKQMVFTCDRPPTELKDFNERLQTRFTAGLTVDLQIPSWETRLAILLKKMESKALKIDLEVLEMVARNVTTNVRDLEAALNQITAYAELTRKPITLEVAQENLKKIFAGIIAPNVTIETVQRVIADYYNLSTNDLKGKKRNQAIVFPRQVAMYLIRELTEYSTTEVGIEFGGRDHTTVMHACQKVEEKLRTDPGFDPVIQNLIRSIKDYGKRSL